jgi:hypothetical protein
MNPSDILLLDRDVDPSGTAPTAVPDIAAVRQPLLSSAVMVGSLAGFSAEGFPLVDHSHHPATQPVPARTTVELTEKEIGRDVVLVFEGGAPDKPIIMGLLQSPRVTPAQTQLVDVRTDGEQLVFSADKEIVLRCGRSSITLTRAGKVLIRGAYLLSRSSGVNRIKGGSVQIN